MVSADHRVLKHQLFINYGNIILKQNQQERWRNDTIWFYSLSFCCDIWPDHVNFPDPRDLYSERQSSSGFLWQQTASYKRMHNVIYLTQQTEETMQKVHMMQKLNNFMILTRKGGLYVSIASACLLHLNPRPETR